MKIIYQIFNSKPVREEELVKIKLEKMKKYCLYFAYSTKI